MQSGQQQSLNPHLNGLQRLLRLEAKWVGYLAHALWEVERIFSHGGWWGPEKDQVCSELLAFTGHRLFLLEDRLKIRNYSWPKTAKRINYIYSQGHGWVKNVTEESISEAEYWKRVEQCKKAIDTCWYMDAQVSQDKLELMKLAKAFLSRQLKFHNCQPMHGLSHQWAPEVQRLITELTNTLTTFNALTNGFESEGLISAEVAVLIKENQHLTPEICGKIILAIFVGRYITTEKGELHEIVASYIDKIAEICFKLHNHFHPQAYEVKQVPPQAAPTSLTHASVLETKQQPPKPAIPAQEVQQRSAAQVLPILPVPVPTLEVKLQPPHTISTPAAVSGIQQTGQIQQALQMAVQTQPVKLTPAPSLPADVQEAEPGTPSASTTQPLKAARAIPAHVQEAEPGTSSAAAARPLRVTREIPDPFMQLPEGMHYMLVTDEERNTIISARESAERRVTMTMTPEQYERVLTLIRDDFSRLDVPLTPVRKP